MFPRRLLIIRRPYNLPLSFFFGVLFSTCSGLGFAQSEELPTEQFDKKILAKELKDPWSISYGPDNQLWITASKSYQILKVDPDNGRLDTLADLSSERRFPRYDNLPDSLEEGKPWPQGGLMGLAVHPDLLKGKPYVYLALVYEYEGSAREGDGRDPDDQGFHFKTKIMRYTYLPDGPSLNEPLIICDSIPGSNDHNGGRLIDSEIENAQKLSPYQDPLWSFHPTDNRALKSIVQQLRNGVKESPEWESIAPSGMSSYSKGAIPSWENSLLITSLKQGSLIRLKLNKEGNKFLERKDYFKGNARYRDVAVSPDGKKIYLITDLSTITSCPTEDNPESTDDR